jgi:hypothetical protein
MLGGAGWQLVTDVNDVIFFGQNNAFFFVNHALKFKYQTW